MTDDRSFHDLSLYGSAAWVATALGISTATFAKKRDALERDGFPKRDRLTGGWLKSDVRNWCQHRATIPPVRDTVGASPFPQEEPRYDRI